MPELLIHEKPSPNFSDRPDAVTPSYLVLHGTYGTDEGDLDWLTAEQSGVSYHYLILRDGRVYRLVPEDKRAWHAGRSEWKGHDDLNDISIGIGLSNLGKEPYTDEQYASLQKLLQYLLAKYRLSRSRVVGHYHISPGRKTDPWYHFEWGRALDF